MPRAWMVAAAHWNDNLDCCSEFCTFSSFKGSFFLKGIKRKVDEKLEKQSFWKPFQEKAIFTVSLGCK